MQTYWVATLALFFIHVGFSFLLGVGFHRARNHNPLNIQITLAIAIGFLMIISIWALPLSTLSMIALFILSSLVLFISSFRFDRLGLQQDWMWLYIALTMGLILLWSINQSQVILAFSMSLLASVACLLALLRSKHIWLR